jgi:hypothetical protein
MVHQSEVAAVPRLSRLKAADKDGSSLPPSAHSMGPNPVSRASLPKMGILAIVTGDFCRIGLSVPVFGSSETDVELQKPANSGLFCSLRGGAPLASEMLGWRRSADRTRLHAISVLSGNLTGNFAILSIRRRFWRRKTLCRRDLSDNSLCKLTGKILRRSRNLKARTGNLIAKRQRLSAVSKMRFWLGSGQRQRNACGVTLAKISHRSSRCSIRFGRSCMPDPHVRQSRNAARERIHLRIPE